MFIKLIRRSFKQAFFYFLIFEITNQLSTKIKLLKDLRTGGCLESL